MQSIEARQVYKNTWNCAVSIFKEESVLSFWSGAIPRLVRLSLSGGIVFTAYSPSKSQSLAEQADGEIQFRKDHGSPRSIGPRSQIHLGVPAHALPRF